MVVRQAARGRVVVTAPAEVDLASAPELAAALAEACAMHPTRVIVDFERTTFCDSAAFDDLLDAAAHLRSSGCELTIHAAPSTLLRMATVLGRAAQLGLPAWPSAPSGR